MPYREMKRQKLPSPPLKSHDVCMDDCVCVDCGHTCKDHHYFNGGLAGCNGVGQYRKSKINGKTVQHQPVSVCKCIGFDRRAYIAGIAARSWRTVMAKSVGVTRRHHKQLGAG